MRPILIVALVVAVPLFGCPRRAETPEAPASAGATTSAEQGAQPTREAGSTGGGAADAAVIAPSATGATTPTAPATTGTTTADAGAQSGHTGAGAGATKPPVTSDGAGEKLDRGASCNADSECGAGLVCEGCGDTDKKCLPGCRKNSDCNAPERCVRVQCIRCPCPSLCGR